MLRRVASPALIARSQQVVCTRGLHSKESALYKRQEDLKKRILELRQDLDLKPYERDPEVVQFVNDSYARINNSSSLSRFVKNRYNNEIEHCINFLFFFLFLYLV